MLKLFSFPICSESPCRHLSFTEKSVRQFEIRFAVLGLCGGGRGLAVAVVGVKVFCLFFAVTMFTVWHLPKNAGTISSLLFAAACMYTLLFISLLFCTCILTLSVYLVSGVSSFCLKLSGALCYTIRETQEAKRRGDISMTHVQI